MAKIFIMIYPWSIKYKDKIFSELDRLGRKLEEKEVKPAEKIIKKQFGKYMNKSFYRQIVSDFKNKRVLIAVYGGNYNEFAKKKEKLREKYGHYSKLAIKGKHRGAVLHTSRNRDEYEKETKLWRDYLNDIVN